MSRPAKGPRLYLYRRKGREPVYIIRDGSYSEGTGCGPDSFGEAKKKLKEYLDRTFRPNTGQRDLAKIRVAEVLMLYGQDIAPTKPSAATIGYHIKALLTYWGDKTLNDVKGSTCRLYLSFRVDRRSGSHGQSGTNINNDGGLQSAHSGRSVKPSTVRRELKTLQAAINHWHRESPLAAVPKVTLPEEGARRERFLERSEAASLLRAAHKLGAKHVARFILIGLYTGTRHSAILRLRWTPALSAGHVDISRAILYRRGSAERETSKRRPPVQMPRRLLSHMRRWFTRDNRSGLSHVVSFQGAPILKMKRAWATVVKEAGLGKDVTPHVLRHTCATWALWRGETIWDVAGLIGADASTVERTYGHHRNLEKEARRA